MNKKIFILSITTIVIVIISLAFIKFNKIRLNLDSSSIYSIKLNFHDNSDDIQKEITNKEDISKVLEYLNSLTLPRTFLRPKDATNSLIFKDSNGKIVESLQFGDSGVLWIGSQTYTLGSSNINTLKSILNTIGVQTTKCGFTTLIF